MGCKCGSSSGQIRVARSTKAAATTVSGIVSAKQTVVTPIRATSNRSVRSAKSTASNSGVAKSGNAVRTVKQNGGRVVTGVRSARDVDAHRDQ